MANEFVARNGLIAQDNSTISGSLTVTNGITGAINGTASYASNANLLDGLDSSVFTSTGSFNAQTASFTAFTSSINSFSSSILTYTSSLNAKTSSFATTGSNTFIGTEVISGSLTISGSGTPFTLNTDILEVTGSLIVTGSTTITGSLLQSGNYTTTGTITAQTINVQQVTSSIVYSCGSNNFGTAIGNTQVFTGSMFITGSNITANISNACFSSNVCVGGGLVAQQPSTFCDTVGLFGASPQLYIGATNGASNYTILKWCTTDKSLNIHNQSTNGSPQLVIACNGNVGVKTIAAPNYNLEVRDNIGIISSTSAGLITTSTLCAAGTVTGLIRFDGLHTPSLTTYTGPSINACKDDANYATSLVFKTTDSSGGNNVNLRIAGTGAACFAGTVCVPTLYTTNCINIGTTTSLGSRLSIESPNDQAGITMYNSYDCNQWSLRTGTTGINNKGFSIVDDICNLTRIQIDGAGRVGIGTLIPQSKFHISIADRCAPRGGGFTKFFLTSNDADTNYYEFQSTATTQSDLLFSTGNTGNYGIIGYNHCTDSMRVYTKSNIRLTINGDGISCFACQVCAPVAIFSGCVGIGITSPSYKLDVYSSTTATQNIANFAAANYGSPSSRTIIQIGTQYEDGSSRIASINTTGNQSALIFQSHAATSGVWNDAMYISGGGEVGIGTTNPTYRLEVCGGSSQVSSFVKYINGDGVNTSFVNLCSNGYSSYIYIGSVPGTDWKLGKNVLNTGSCTYFQIVDSSNNLRLQINSSDGNVGIGTASPAYKLDVNGNIGAGFFTGQCMALNSWSSNSGLILNYGNASGQVTAINIRANGITNGYIGMQMVDSSDGDLWLGSSIGRAVTIYRTGNTGFNTNTPCTRVHVEGGYGSTWGGCACYYGGGAAGGGIPNGDIYGNGAAYTYQTCNTTANNSVLRGGFAAGYFRGGDGGNYGGGGAGIVAIGGNGANSESVNSGGGAGIFARGGLNGAGSAIAYAAWFDGGDVVIRCGKFGINTCYPTAMFEAGKVCENTTAGGFLFDTKSVADSNWFCFFQPTSNWAGLMTMHWVAPNDHNRSGAAQVRWSYQNCSAGLGPTTSIFNDSQNATATFRYAGGWLQACISGAGAGYSVQFTIMGARGA
jgi:hypothetical protein